MFIEAVLRIRSRNDFDENLGTIEYAADRRTNVVTLTYFEKYVMLIVSSEPNVDIDDTVRKIKKLLES